MFYKKFDALACRFLGFYVNFPCFVTDCVCGLSSRASERDRELRALATVLFFQSTLYQAEIKGKAIIIHDGAIACVFFVACVDVCDAKSCVSIVLLAAWFITVSIIGREWGKKGNNSGDLLTQSELRTTNVRLCETNLMRAYTTLY